MSEIENKMAAVQLAEWINENEHLKGTQQYNDVASGLKESVALDVEEKYQDLFAKQAPEETGAFSDFSRAFGINALEVGAGLNQMALEGASKFGIPGADDLLKDYTGTMSEFTKQQKALTEDSPVASFFGDVLSDTALLVASPTGKADSAKSIYKKMVESGVELGALEGVKLVDEDGNRLSIAAGAAALGGLSRGALEGVIGGFNKIKGKASERISTELDELSKRFDVDVSVGDLTQSKPWQLTENLLDRVPFIGTGDFARRQGESLEQAANKLIANYGVPEDEISNFLTGAVKNKYKKVKEVSDANYANVSKALGGKSVQYNNANEAAADLIEELRPNQNTPEIKKIMDEVKRFLPKDYFGEDEAGKLINRTGLGGYEKSFDDAFNQLKIYGKLRYQASKSGDENLREVYDTMAKAIQRDIDELADNVGGDAATALSKAKSYYAKEVAPYTKGQFLKIRKPDDFPTFNADNIYSTFVKPNAKGTKNLRKLTDKIELDDVQMLKQQVLSDAHTAATVKDVFDPSVFASQLKKMGESRKVIFNKAENDVLDGYVKLANMLPRAKLSSNQQAANISRVAGSVPGLAAGTAGLGAATGASPLVAGGLGIMGGIKGLSLLLTSPAGKKLLTTVNKNPDKAETLLGAINKEVLDLTRTKVVPVASVPSVNLEDEE